MQNAFTLLQVANSIRKTISQRYTSSFWVKAEMNKLNFYKHSGHCYPELVEKENGKVIAQMNGILWKSDFEVANRKFLTQLKEPLKDGIKILFLAKITFDPAHGLALQILDIDPAYTMGDLEREKQETIDRLRNEGIFDRNKRLQFPLLPQRIAIISVETSKGYADFLSVISNNQWNYKFFHMLFPSLLQGEKAVDGIIHQLNQIRKVLDHFDVVAIIRGGGGDVGLSCYNSYRMAKEIANFPLPVITGIGHATNETVAEIIAHLNAITPTKLADYLMQHFHNFSVPVQKAEDILQNTVRKRLTDQKLGLNNEVRHFRASAEKMLIRSRNELSSQSNSLIRQSQFRFRSEHAGILIANSNLERTAKSLLARQEKDIAGLTEHLTKDVRAMLQRQITGLDNIERNIQNMSPSNVLKRGYSITLHNGLALTDASSISEGDMIETKLHQGSIISKAKTINTTNEGNQ